MTNDESRSRRLLHRAAATVLVPLGLLALAAVVAANPAAAICHGDQCGTPDPHWTWTSTTVVEPIDGSVDIDPYTASGRTCDEVNVSACTITDTQVTDEDVRPATGWPQHVLTWSGQPGFAPDWGGPCFAAANPCVFTNDQDTAVVQVNAQDVQAPTVSLSVPARINAQTAWTAIGSDNAGVVAYRWHVCGPEWCHDLRFTTPSLRMGSAPEGTYTIQVQAEDASGNLSTPATATTSLAPSLALTLWTPSTAIDSAALTYWTNEDDHITVRQCRAYRVGTAAPAFGACTNSTSYAPAVTDGAWVLDVQVTDDTGQQASGSRTITIDTVAPALAFADAPTEGAQVTTSSVSFGFTGSDANLVGYTCSLDGADPAPCTSPDTLTGTANGEHALTVTARDAAGHTTTIVRHFSVLVRSAMVADPNRVTSTYGTAASLSVSISPIAATGRVRFLTSTGRLLCTATVADGRASCTAPPRLAVGTYAITAHYLGNYSSSTGHLSLVVSKRS